jgi:hypothetical protein
VSTLEDEIENRARLDRAVLRLIAGDIDLPPPKGPHPPRREAGGLFCWHCDRQLATAVIHNITVESATYFDGDIDGHGYARQVPIGATVTLAPGYVNATKRHPSGARWYVRGKSASSPAPRVRLPAIVTCRCGQEVRLDSSPQYAYASDDATSRVTRLDSEIELEAEDEYIQREADIRRGK